MTGGETPGGRGAIESPVPPASTSGADGQPDARSARPGRLTVTRGQFLAGSLALIGAGLASGFYAWQVEPHWLEIVTRPMAIDGLPPALDGARLLHLTDIHVGPRVSDSFVVEVFRRLAALEPDIVVVTGDFTSYHPEVLERARRVYAEMPRGRLATLGVLGNHDYGPGWADRRAADSLQGVVAGLGLTVLRNEVMEVAGLQIVGMDDLWAKSFQPRTALAALEKGRPVLALCHNPDCVDRPGWGGYTGWVLAGHTHGGQCKPPFLPPPVLPVENRRYTSGEFAVGGGRRLYISRGVGHLQQVRFNARPEATVFELRPAGLHQVSSGRRTG